ncbi:MAG: guanylate kinase [Bdellovibrionales bacterium]|nr:guanylate kinase [Bdellovibrionales bacterium]
MSKFKILNKGPICFVISSPSGAGKTTLVSEALSRLVNVKKTVSHTTRTPREGEKNGVDYYFVTNSDFENAMANDEFIEYANVYGQWYGTSVHTIKNILDQNQDAMLVIENQGAKEVVKKFPNVVLILIMPPSMEELTRRLIQREGSTTQDVEKRLSQAQEEIKAMQWYDHKIVNDHFDKASTELVELIQGYQKSRHN